MITVHYITWQNGWGYGLQNWTYIKIELLCATYHYNSLVGGSKLTDIILQQTTLQGIL